MAFGCRELQLQVEFIFVKFDLKLALMSKAVVKLNFLILLRSKPGGLMLCKRVKICLTMQISQLQVFPAAFYIYLFFSCYCCSTKLLGILHFKIIFDFVECGYAAGKTFKTGVKIIYSKFAS